MKINNVMAIMVLQKRKSEMAHDALYQLHLFPPTPHPHCEIDEVFQEWEAPPTVHIPAQELERRDKFLSTRTGTALCTVMKKRDGKIFAKVEGGAEEGDPIHITFEFQEVVKKLLEAYEPPLFSFNP